MRAIAMVPHESNQKVFTAIMDDESFTDSDFSSEKEFRDYLSEAFPGTKIIRVINHQITKTEDSYDIYDIDLEEL